MEKVRLIIDSSSNVMNGTHENLVVVPLTLFLGKDQFRDDNNLDISTFLKKMEQSKVTGRTSCPSINQWLDALNGSKKAIIVTVTSALSGSYSAALQAKEIYQEKNPDSSVIVVDTRSAGSEMSLIIENIKKMIQANIRWGDLEEKIAQMQVKTHVLFVLGSLHNLTLNGRISPAVSKVAKMLHINIVGTIGKEGRLEPTAKVRGMKKAIKEIVAQMQKMKFDGGSAIIDYCNNKSRAEKLKEEILLKYPNSQIKIRAMRGICSFYIEENGLMVGFQE